MKVILFFVILWNTSPISVEKKSIKEFNSMVECEQTQVIFREAGRLNPIIITNEADLEGLVIGSLCEEEVQTT